MAEEPRHPVLTVFDNPKKEAPQFSETRVIPLATLIVFAIMDIMGPKRFTFYYNKVPLNEGFEKCP